MIRILLLFVAVTIIPLNLFSQILIIKDKDTEEAIETASLSDNRGNFYQMVNAKGYADLSGFDKNDSIYISSVGYEPKKIKLSDYSSRTDIVYLTPSSVEIDHIVVSASRWNQSAREVPVRIKSISRKEIRLQNPQTAADMLSLSGEVYIQKSQQGGGSPMIRGFSTNRLLYVIDGVRMNTAIFRSGNLQNVISLDPFSLQNTEVLFGPGSVIYGSDAIGGVMNFTTLQSQLSVSDKVLVSGKAATRYSSANNEKTAHFHVLAGGKKWASATSITTNDYGDLKAGARGEYDYRKYEFVRRINNEDVIVQNPDPLIQKPSGYTQKNLMQKFRFKPDDVWDINYGFHYSETSDYGRYDRHLRTRDGKPRYGEWKYGPQIWMFNNLNIELIKQNILFDGAELSLAHQFFEESRISRDFKDPMQETRVENVYAYSANLDFIKKIGSRHTFNYGAEAVYNDVLSEGINKNIFTDITAEAPSRYPISSWESYGIYLNDKIKFSDKWLTQAGFRFNYNRLNAEFDTRFYPFPFQTADSESPSLTGNLGIVYRPDEQWVISLNAAKGFRAPNVDDMGKVFDSEPGSVVVPNPDLEAEEAYNLEFGLAKVFGKSVKIDFSAYYTLLENAMVRRDFQLNGQDSMIYDGEMSKIQAVQNAASASVYGVQAGIELKLPRGFSASGHYNYQKGEEEADDGTVSPSRHAPPAFGVFRLMYAYEKLNMQIYGEFNAEKSYEEMPEGEKSKTYMYASDADGQPFSPAWYTLNYKAKYKVSEAFSVFAGIENITDQAYRPYSSGIAAPGRNFIISVRIAF